MFGQIQMINTRNNLNNVAVEYFGLGLRELSYQIWRGLYYEIRDNSGSGDEILPIISCNMGNVLRQDGCYEEAYRVCMQGLKYCFETGAAYAVPELMLQLAVLCMKMGETEKARWLHFFGIRCFCWSRQAGVRQTMDEIMEQDFLLYC